MAAMMQPCLEYAIIITLFEKIRKALHGPVFTCPKCHKVIKNRPVQVYAMKNMAGKVTSALGEEEPEDTNPRHGGKLVSGRDNPWDKFFPFHNVMHQDNEIHKYDHMYDARECMNTKGKRAN
ncbi:hypothetical protein IW262DRAFT_1302610 [Armillaria fumosa]|nr:hypothetical protein IW262DRAFT_1302610 [Armillaria fumosa]